MVNLNKLFNLIFVKYKSCLDYMAPVNFSYLWNFGIFALLCLVIQIVRLFSVYCFGGDLFFTYVFLFYLSSILFFIYWGGRVFEAIFPSDPACPKCLGSFDLVTIGVGTALFFCGIDSLLYICWVRANV